MNLDSPLQCILPVESDHATTKSYLRAMERLLLVVQELSLARCLEEIMQIVRVATRELTGSDGSTFVLRDNGYCYYADEDAIAPLWKGQKFPINSCVSGWAMLNHRPAVIEDIYKDDRVPIDVYRATFVKSLVMVPIRTLEPLGAIGTYWANYYQPRIEEVKLLQALADTTAVALENVLVHSELEQRVRDRTATLEATNNRLQQEINLRTASEAEVRRISLTDELTGLNNRRGFFVLAEKQLKKAHKKNRPIHLLFIDLDGLKYINDHFGHDMGDVAIIGAATILKQTFQESGIVARLGGDEFVVFIQGNQCDCDHFLEQLQNAINHFNQTQNQPFQISMSIGVQAHDPTQPISLDDLITLADVKMYQNKRAKRANR
ncbi:MAG TPA: sensor domain-containing diguanylate cyclase [Nostocaceae cyanobacterium]|nr:sensor domain-containing diguanylate cyclase [Nostocaceae cyanobacterium]